MNTKSVKVKLLREVKHRYQIEFLKLHAIVEVNEELFQKMFHSDLYDFVEERADYQKTFITNS